MMVENVNINQWDQYPSWNYWQTVLQKSIQIHVARYLFINQSGSRMSAEIIKLELDLLWTTDYNTHRVVLFTYYLFFVVCYFLLCSPETKKMFILKK